jgi:hypothetical protein
MKSVWSLCWEENGNDDGLEAGEVNIPAQMYMKGSSLGEDLCISSEKYEKMADMFHHPFAFL